MDPATAATVNPDEETKERIKNLAFVGRALDEISNETGGQTDYFLAESALKTFADGIHRLRLDPESMEGMDSLIRYLEKKIKKRMGQSVNSY